MGKPPSNWTATWWQRVLIISAVVGYAGAFGIVMFALSGDIMKQSFAVVILTALALMVVWAWSRRLQLTSRIPWMVRVKRPALRIVADGKSPVLFPLFRGVVVQLAQALARAVPELGRITIMALDVVADDGRRQVAELEAHGAQRLKLELLSRYRPPAGRPIPRAPRLLMIATPVLRLTLLLAGTER